MNKRNSKDMHTHSLIHMHKHTYVNMGVHLYTRTYVLSSFTFLTFNINNC